MAKDQSIEEILEQALELKDFDERTTYLEEACGGAQGHQAGDGFQGKE